MTKETIKKQERVEGNFLAKISKKLTTAVSIFSIMILASCGVQDDPEPDKTPIKDKEISDSWTNTINIRRIADQKRQVGKTVFISLSGVDDFREKIIPVISKSSDIFDVEITESGNIEITFLKVGEGDLTLSYTSKEKTETYTNRDGEEYIVTYTPQTKTQVIHIASTKDAPEPLQILRKNGISMIRALYPTDSVGTTIFYGLSEVDDFGEKVIPVVSKSGDIFDTEITKYGTELQLKVTLLKVGKGDLILSYTTKEKTKTIEDTNDDGVDDMHHKQ